MNINKAVKDYITRLELRGQSPQTRKNVQFHLDAFTKWLMDAYSIEETKFLRKFHLQAFQKHLGIDCNYSANYVNQKVMAVNSLMKYLYREGQIIQGLENALECMKTPKKLPQVISVDDYDQILKSTPLKDKVSLRNHTIVVLLMSSGIRVGGLSKLTVKDVSLDEKTIKVTGKGGKERLAVFGENCKEVLRVYLNSVRPLFKGSKANEALFLSMNNKAMSIRSYQDVIKQMAKAAGLTERVTPHTFRRTFCTELIKADGNLYHIAQMMGHESLEHLKCYARLNIKPLKETHKKCHPRG